MDLEKEYENNLKLMLNNTITDKTVTYASETWIPTER
jgi:hypothetical protein